MVKYTPEQNKAINDQDRDILVSASAGSGKTMVLVERVLRLLLDKNSLDNMIVITFTKAAAEEMKQRIKKILNQKVVSSPDNAFLRNELIKVDTANISTIDAFCLDVIRRFYFAIDLDPSFSILTDPTQSELLKERALKEVEAEYLEKKDSSFTQFYENFVGDHNADSARQILLDLYNFAMAKPDYKKWLQTLPDNYQVGDDLVDSIIWQKQIKPYLQLRIKDLNQKIDQVLKVPIIENGELDQVKYNFELFGKTIHIYQDLLDQDADFDRQQAALRNCQFTISTRKKPKWDEDIAEFYATSQTIKNDIKKIIFDIYTAFYAADNDLQTKAMQEGQKIVATISQVELKLIKHFQDLKKEQNLIDYADMEQYAYQILSQDTSNSQMARQYYQHKFQNILVDEYQDINALQEKIIQLIKTKDNHLFMVGDVKQSIYGFRQAEPSLFLNKYQEYSNIDEKERIVLGDNFRSSKAVIQNVNKLFDPLLTEDFGGINYQTEGRLSYGADYDDQIGQATEFIYHEKIKDSDQDSDQVDFDEIQMVISRIKQLKKEKFKIFDPKTHEMRPFEYSDIAILTRSRSNNLNIMQQFAENNMPLFVSDAENYFQTFELTIILAYLKIIDNPDQDIPLVTVMRSPLYKFDETDFAKIRIHSKNASFYTALTSYVSIHDELANKVKLFLNDLQNLREFATNHRISELIWSIYEKTDLLDIVTGMPNGHQRRVNLQALYERANSYESAGFKGLYQFISFINRMRASQKDLAQPLLSKQAGNAVKLMTIHGSKGLEFPIVFYVGLAHHFQMRDLNENYIITPNSLGITINFSKYRLDTLVKSMGNVLEKKQLLEEESRIMYVAVTRAKQKLIMVADIANFGKKIKTWEMQLNNGLLDINAKLQASTPLDMFGPQLDFGENISQNINDLTLNIDEVPKMIYVKYDPQTQQINIKAKVEAGLQTESKLILQTANKLYSFNYPFDTSTKTTAYQAVSEIKSAFNNPDDVDLANSHLIKSSNRYLQTIDTKPNFLYQTKFTGAQKGTAMHLILQYYDYFHHEKDQLDFEIDKLIKQGQLNSHIVEELPLDEIEWFVNSKFAQRFWQKPKQLFREVDFSSLIKASTIFSKFDDPNAKILVHGTIDGYYQEDDGIILFDYKTDYVDKTHHQEALNDLTKKYSGQLNLYEKALSEMTGKKVKEKYLVLLNSKELLPLK